MFGWRPIEAVVTGITVGFLVLLALGTRPGSSILFKGEKRPSEKTLKYVHAVVVVGLAVVFVCFLASVICYHYTGG